MRLSFQKSRYKHFLLYLLVTTSVVLLYAHLSWLWSSTGGASVRLFRLEIPLLLLLSVLFYFPDIKSKAVKYATFPIFIVIFYISTDLFYSFLGRSPHFSDFENIKKIFSFSETITAVTIFFLLLVSFVLSSFLRQLSANRSLKKSYKLFLLRSLIVLFFSGLFYSESCASLYSELFNAVPSSPQVKIKNNGRVASFIYHGLEERYSRKKLREHTLCKQVNVENILFPGVIEKRRNIYIIVLESFIDVRLLRNVVFEKTPLFKGMKPYLIKNNSFSYTISPVYGGGTAQAEFEILTGIKSFGKIKSIEFNVMHGRKMSGLVDRLKRNGYQTSAVIAADKGYYNSPNAYKSIGFDSLVFLKEVYPFSENDAVVFDGDLFDYSRRKIESSRAGEGKPQLNYILGMYGHLPYQRDTKKRPDKVHVKGGNEKVRKISNQFYYRTKEVARYIDFLLVHDPDSLIYITSDHLPPIITRDIRYKYNIYQNISLLIDRGRTVDVTGKKYFEIPWLLWDILCERKHPREIDARKMEELYFTVLAESVSEAKEEKKRYHDEGGYSRPDLSGSSVSPRRAGRAVFRQ